MKISLKKTSICIFKCTLKRASSARNNARDNSNTSGTEETPFFDNATQRYCFMAITNISLERNTGPAFCSIPRSNCKERIFDLN